MCASSGCASKLTAVQLFLSNTFCSTRRPVQPVVPTSCLPPVLSLVCCTLGPNLLQCAVQYRLQRLQVHPGALIRPEVGRVRPLWQLQVRRGVRLVACSTAPHKSGDYAAHYCTALIAEYFTRVCSVASATADPPRTSRDCKSTQGLCSAKKLGVSGPSGSLAVRNCTSPSRQSVRLALAMLIHWGL